MPDIEELTIHKLEELLEYLELAPIDLSSVIYHDKLFELAESVVINDLVAELEAKADEEKLKDYDEI